MTTPSQAGPAPDPQALAKRLELSFRVGQILGPDYDGVSFDDVARELVQVKADLAAVRAQLEESIHSPVLQAVLDACSGKLDPSTQIADHPNVKFAQMERLKLKAALTALRAQLQANTNEYIEVVHDQGVKLMQAEAALAELRAREFVKKCDALPPQAREPEK